jgi:carboxyl-terminal processing protease
VVLDLRGNRGGLLREAVATASALLPPGLVAVTAGRDPQATRAWRTDVGEIAGGLPLVVLVDGRSASAAEVLAAALSDRGRAVVVGSATLGKGLVQTIDALPDGGELFLTWSRILAPGGWPIQGLGVLPQICTSLGQDALSRQLSALAEGTQPMQEAIDRHRAARAPLTPTQVLALRAACPAAEGRDLDMATARTVIANPAVYAAALLPVSNGQ